MSPVFDGTKLKPGAFFISVLLVHISQRCRKIPSETVEGAHIVVDSLSATLQRREDLVIPIRSGLIKAEDINTELGEIISGTKPGRKSPDEITLFKSVGIAAQDAMAAQAALEYAQKLRRTWANDRR